MRHFTKGVAAGIASAVTVAVLLGSGIVQFVPPPGGVAGQFLATDGATPATYSWATAAQPPAQDNSNHLVSGGSVAWIPGTLQYVVQAAVYVINGVQYTSPQTTLTLVADGGADRIDTIILNSSGVATFLAGAPSGTPVAPVADPATELELTFAYIAAGAGVPSNVSSVLIYDEDAGGPTEWTTTVSGAGMASASLTNPYHLTKDVEATATTSGQYAQFVAGAPFNPLNYNTLVFYIRAKTGWGNNRQLQFQWMNGGAATGNPVSLRNGAFGFSTSNTTSYQQIVIPLQQFSAQILLGTVDRLRITVAGSGGTVGFYLDYVQLQAGITAAPGTYMHWTGGTGTWNPAVGYNVNDVVVRSGTPYVSIAPSVNQTPPNASYWAPMVTGGVGWPAWAHASTTVAFSATPTFDASLSRTFEMTLTNNVTSSTISNPQEDGQTIIFRICQDGTGGRTFAWPANVFGAMVVGSQLSTCSVQSFNYRLSNTTWYAEGNPGVVNQ